MWRLFICFIAYVKILDWHHHLGFFRHRRPLLSSLTSYVVHGNWINILVFHDMLYELKSKWRNNKTFIDEYYLHRVAQQFILLQEIPFLTNYTSNGLTKPTLGQEEVNLQLKNH